MPKNSSINLLPQEEFDASLLGRALKWAMSTFRIIVIITEIVVMGAFLSRFWLDAQNSDLTNAIKVKAAQIKARSETEKSFRSVQSKLNIIKLMEQSATSSEKINSIISLLPQGVNLTSLSVTDSSAQIRGASDSEIGIAQFIANLQSSFKNVDLGQINSSETNVFQTSFSINITY